MEIYDDEILAIWARFYEKGLRYIMVGGFAINLHGHLRTTGDVDIWIEDTTENRKILRQSLIELEIGDFEAIERIDFIPSWSSIQLNSGIELDVMTYLKAFSQESFDECFALASTAEIENIPVRFLHINHLIKEKKLLAYRFVILSRSRRSPWKTDQWF